MNQLPLELEFKFAAFCNDVDKMSLDQAKEMLRELFINKLAYEHTVKQMLRDKLSN